MDSVCCQLVEQTAFWTDRESVDLGVIPVYNAYTDTDQTYQ